MNDDFPSSKYERGKIIGKTGIKMGTNYAKKYLKDKLSKNDDSSSEFHFKNAQAIFKELTKLRGTALKIAQTVSMDQGILPDEFADVMTQAQYSVPPVNKALVRSIIKKELGDYPEKLFESFEAEAFAAASLGQVHKAVLKDGRKAAVKIQYPNVRETITSDLGLARSLVKRFLSKDADIEPYFEEIKETLLNETNYQFEGEQLELFKNRFGDGTLVFPEWIQELSTDKVICMTFLEGRHLNEFLNEDPSQEQRNHFGQLLWDFFHHQIEQRDFVHADTHPGNFLFIGNDKLGVVDFGCVKKFPEDFFNNYLRLLPAHLKDDEELIKNLYVELDVIDPNPKNPKKEREYYTFARNYGKIFSEPYKYDFFDFGKTDFKEQIRHFTKEAPLSNEPRGNKNFIFTTRVHLGLYNLLMKLEAEIDIAESKLILGKLLNTTFDDLSEPGTGP